MRKKQPYNHPARIKIKRFEPTPEEIEEAKRAFFASGGVVKQIDKAFVDISNPACTNPAFPDISDMSLVER